MNRTHLSEEKIQEYVIGGLTDVDSFGHIELCKSCNIKAKAYQLIFEEIKESAKPASEFDLAAAILDQLAVEEPISVRWYLPGYLWGICATLLFAGPAFCYRQLLADVITKVQPAVFVTVIAAAVMIVAFRIIELNHKSVKQTALLRTCLNIC